jgi:DNA-binding NarL/FixJ family response regulator
MIRILLVDDHAVVRNGYRRLLDAEPDLRVVAEAASAEEANAALQRTACDCALVDLSLRGSSGLEAIRGLLARQPGLRVLVLSMHDGSGYVTQAIRAGAAGYLTKHCEPGEVIVAIRQVMQGRRVLAPEIAGALADAALAGTSPFSGLTPREFDVLRQLVGGAPPQTIAANLHLSPKTILNYLSLIRQKLDAETDFKLLHLAARHGLVDLPATALDCAA